MAQVNTHQDYKMTRCDNLEAATTSKMAFRDFSNGALAGKEQEDGAGFFVSLTSLKEMVQTLDDGQMDGFQICLGMDEQRKIDLILTSIHFLEGNREDNTPNREIGPIFWTRPPIEPDGLACKPGPINCA